MATKILLVDDDAVLRRTLKYRLEHEGYAVTTTETGEEALTCARQEHPDLILLDIGLPGIDGLAVARTLEREIDARIIFLTARTQETDVVVGLELGAEDYIAKPFRTRELLARIRVVLRRTASPTQVLRDAPLMVGDIALDPRAHTVHVRGKPVELPPREFELLRILMANAGTVLTTDYLLNAVWGEEFAGAVQVLYVRIGWLRELIEPEPHHPRYIETVRGVGYKFVGGGEMP